MYIRRFRHDPTRFEHSQQRVHRGREMKVTMKY